MPSRMSRRAVLKAMGISPVILSLSASEGRSAEREQANTVVAQYASQITTRDVDEVVKKGKKHYKKHHSNKDWSGNGKNKYTNLATSLPAFYLAGIDHVRVQKGLNTLVRAADFMSKAYNYGTTTSGESVAKNLDGFSGNHGGIDIETEICAYRCGIKAAEIELADDSSAKVVTMDSFETAWVSISLEVQKLRARMKNQQLSGGGC